MDNLEHFISGYGDGDEEIDFSNYDDQFGLIDFSNYDDDDGTDYDTDYDSEDFDDVDDFEEQEAKFRAERDELQEKYDTGVGGCKKIMT